jgi:CRP-like cAMP-binding protein
LDFGRKATKLRIRMDSSAVSFQLSYSSSLVGPDLTSSTFWRRQMPAAMMSIGLRQSCREPTATAAVLKSHGSGRFNAIPLTQDFLAQMLGVRRTTVNATASLLQSGGVIRYHRGFGFAIGEKHTELGKASETNLNVLPQSGSTALA